MKSRALLGASLAAAIVLAAGCDESTSGADRMAIDPDAGADAGIDMVLAPKVDGGLADDSGNAPVSACLACAATSCQDALTACGDECLAALACAEACDNAVCRERCLRTVDSAAGTAFRSCYLFSCGDDCTDLGALLTGVQLYAKIYCAGEAFCAPGSLQFYYGDQAGCQQAIGAYYYNSAALPGSGVSLTTLEGCAARASAMTCGDFRSSRFDLACQIQGTKAIGEPCFEDAQCESSFCPGPNRVCATCQLLPGVNDACNQGRCAPGLLCNASNVCVAGVRVGQACNATAICEDGNCVGGMCTAYPTQGQPCNAATGPYCDFSRGFTCASNKTCLPFTAAKPSASCAPVSGRVSACQNNATCVGGVCAALPKVGEPCDDDDGPYCTWPAVCKDGTCVGFPSPYPCE